MKKDIYILGIESSCDETAAAVVKNGCEIVSDVVYSQVDIHAKYGGVVPEIASRNHIEAIDKVVFEALKKAEMELSQLDAIAVTYGAGLIGSLLVGVSFAKALSYKTKLPLVAVNHIQAHIAAGYLADQDLKPPFTALVISGGHTAVVNIKGYTSYQILEQTTDDAVGEAFDKVARVLGVPYPGGQGLDRLAQKGTVQQSFFKTPRSLENFKISYSGLKTALINHIHNLNQKGIEPNKNDIAATFSADAFDMLIDFTVRCAKQSSNSTILACGGVAANTYLRRQLDLACKKEGIRALFPPLSLCGDNGAMVAASGYYNFVDNINIAPYDLNAQSSLDIDEILC